MQICTHKTGDVRARVDIKCKQGQVPVPKSLSLCCQVLVSKKVSFLQSRVDSAINQPFLLPSTILEGAISSGRGP